MLCCCCCGYPSSSSRWKYCTNGNQASCQKDLLQIDLLQCKAVFKWSKIIFFVLLKKYFSRLHQPTAASTWWCAPRPRLGWVEMAVGLPGGPSYPGHSAFIFLLCCPLNDRRRAGWLGCTNQQPLQRGGALSGPVWVGSKWLLAFPGVPVTPGTPHSFFCYAAP